MVVYFHASAAVLSLLVAGLLLVGRSKSTVNLLLACFLGVVAGSEGAVVARHLIADGAIELTWFRVEWALSFLAPGLLFWFGSLFPERNRLNTRAGVGGALALSFGLVGTVPWLRPVGTGHAMSTGVFVLGTLFTGVVYVLVLHQVASPLREQDQDQAPAHAMAYPAFCLLTVQAWARFADTTFTGLPDLAGLASLGLSAPVYDHMAPVVGPTAGLITVGAILTYTLAAEGSRENAGVFAVGIGVAAILQGLTSAQPLLAYLGQAGLYAGTVPGWLPSASVAVGLTWLIFALLLSGALLRYRVLDMSIRNRRLGARVVAMFILLDVAILAFRAVAGPDWRAAGGFDPAALALFLVVFALSDRFWSAADRLGEALYGVPADADADQRVRLYRHGVRQAIKEGQSGLDPRLEELREELDIDPEVARTVERSVAAGGDRPVAVGERLADRYDVEELLGRGGAGRTFRARDRLLDRDVVLKEVLHGNPDEARRVLEEARSAGQLQHPNVVVVYDVLRRAHSSIIVMEHVVGGSLKCRVEEEGPLSVEQAAYLGRRVLDGLAEIHEAGIIHRDLKPANILIDQEGEPKITDFGLARREETRGLDETPAGEGTPGYMAPEQRRGREVTPASDLYAVGRLLDEVTEDPLPEPLAAAVEPALREDPARRWGSAKAMKGALETAEALPVPEQEQ